MNLAFCVYRYRPYGGLERTVLELARAARARGHRVEVFTRAWEGPRPAGIEVHELAVHALTNAGLDRAYARACRAALARARPDVVVGFNRLEGLDVFYAADPCLAGAPVRARLPRLNRRQRERLERRIAAPRAGVEILVLSADERERYRRHHATPAERLHVLPPGLEPTFLEGRRDPGPTVRQELGLDADARLVLSVGSDFARKGLDRSLRALSALEPELRARTWLAVLGAGRPARFRRLARTLGLEARVRFLGGRTDVLGAYRGADLLLHPARVENGGRVLLEAMSQGVAVVCTDACGFAPIVATAGAGHVLAEPLAEDELRGVLATLLADDSARQALAQRGPPAARAYPLERRTRLALDVIEGAARRRRALRGVGSAR